ncbi:MAG: hypothetical protein MJZ11_08160 [Lachnospiraceae bacterium]|nr:hypothetical protein [Lachnospiraceae bacterium]
MATYAAKATSFARAMGITCVDFTGGEAKVLPPMTQEELKTEMISNKRNELMTMPEEEFYKEVGSMSSDELEAILSLG